jgi:G3E family GTPase
MLMKKRAMLTAKPFLRAQVTQRLQHIGQQNPRDTSASKIRALPVFKNDTPLYRSAVAEHPEVAHSPQNHRHGDNNHVLCFRAIPSRNQNAENALELLQQLRLTGFLLLKSRVKLSKHGAKS